MVGNFQIKSRNEDILSLESELGSHKETITTKELALNKLQIDKWVYWLMI